MDNLEEIDRFLEKFSLSRLNQEEIEIMNNPTTITEFEAVLKKSPKKQKKPQSINSSVLSFLHSPTLTSIHDHWKNHSLD